jgi:hypothetical protein
MVMAAGLCPAAIAFGSPLGPVAAWQQVRCEKSALYASSVALCRVALE